MVPVMIAAEGGERRSLQRRWWWWGRGEEVAAKRSPTQIAGDERRGGGQRPLQTAPNKGTRDVLRGYRLVFPQRKKRFFDARRSRIASSPRSAKKQKIKNTFSGTVEV